MEIRVYIEQSGQRNAVLIERESGIPDYWSTLYVTNRLRARGNEVATIKKHLESISAFYTWLKILDINVVDRISCGNFFKQYEIDSLTSVLKLENNEVPKHFQLAQRNVGVIDITTKRPRTLWDTLDSIPRQISSKAYNDKIRHVAAFIIWLSNTLSDTPKNGATRDVVSAVGFEFSERLKSLKVEEPTNSFRDIKSLSNAQIRRVMEVMVPSSPENPWFDEGVRVRNFAIILILLDAGIRSAELRNLKITDIIRGKAKSNGLRVVNRSGSKNDPRVKQPNPKTPQSERDVPLGHTAFRALDIYVTRYRVDVPNSQSSEYIFLNHGNDSRYVGKPISSLNSITDKVRKLTGVDLEPHSIRHTSAWKFCVEKKKEGKKWEDIVELLVLKFGWSNSNSPSVRLYAKKFIRDELFVRKLEEQDKTAAMVAEALNLLKGGS